MSKKMVWQCDQDGYLVGEVELSKRSGDWGKSGWLVPAGCVEIKPPIEKEGFALKWQDEKWAYEEVALEEVQETKKMPEIDPLEILNWQFVQEKEELLKAYITAELYEDDDLKREIRLELQELEIKYSEEAEKIKVKEELKEVQS